MRDYSGNGITRNKLTRNNLGNTRNQPLMDMVVSGMSACSLLSGGDGGNPHQKPQHHAMTDKGDIGSKRLLKRRSRSPDDFYAPVSSNNDSDCDMYSLIGPGALQSFSDSTQCDISSLEFSDIGQPGPLPLNCVWGNGMQYQPNINISNTANQYPSATHSQATVSVPLISTTPSFNPHLPFPDKSGNMTLFSYGMQGSMMSPPPPTLNASLGYPTVYVSPAGLITVLLKYDVAIEMTVDKNIRVVNHRHKAVAASNNRGSANCVYHVAAKIYQEGTKVEAEVFGDRRARMQTDGILFAASTEVYLLDDKHIVPSHFIFNNMSKDSSVNILFGASGQNFTNDVLIQCDAITKSSKYYFHKDGSTTIIINGVKIHQDAQGEVSVKAGPRIISTSPVFGNIYLQTHFVEISVQVCHHELKNPPNI